MTVQGPLLSAGEGAADAWAVISHSPGAPLRPAFADHSIFAMPTPSGVWKVTAPTELSPALTVYSPSSKLVYPAMLSKSAVYVCPFDPISVASLFASSENVPKA